MKRRKFLQHTAHSLALPGILSSVGIAATSERALATVLRTAQESNRILVLVFLDGGNDGLNTIVPLSELSALNAVRPHVVLPESELLTVTGKDLGFHPSLQNFKSLYEEGRLEIIQSVGYPNPNYSHFRSTDIWMSGSDSDQHLNSGWVGRYLNHTHPNYPEQYPNPENPHPLSIEIGYGASLLFQGPTDSMGMVISGPDSFYELINETDPDFPETRVGEKLRYLQLIAKQSQEYGKVILEAAQKAPNQGDFPETQLGEQLRIVSRLIAGGMQTPLYMVRIGGFDTHDSQVEPGDTTMGEHAQLLGELDEAIMAFLKDLERHGNEERVIGMTFSEFGRTIVSNASNGTDHGTAAPMFLFGSQVRGGVVGEDPTISPYTKYEDDLPMQFDFRQIYASVLEQWFGMGNSDISAVLLNEFATTQVIGEDNVITGTKKEMGDLVVYPNPLNGRATVSFTSLGEDISIELMDLHGRRVINIFKGKSQVGYNQKSFNTSSITSGRYFVILSSRTKRQVFNVVK